MNRRPIFLALGVPALALLLFWLLVPVHRDPRLFLRLMFGAQMAEQDREFQRYRAVADTARAFETAWRAADARVRANGLGPVAGVLVTSDRGAADPHRAAAERLVREELGALGAATPRAPVAVVVLHDEDLQYPRYVREVVLPERSGAACTVVLRLSARFPHFAGTGSTDRLLGTCAFHAAYGAPGAGMQQWLTETNLQRAAYLQRPASHGDGVVRDPGEANAAGRDAVVAACRSGRVEGCRELWMARVDTLLLEPWQRSLPTVAPPELRVATFGPSSFAAPRSAISAGLLASLAEHLGPERFAEVWRAPGSPEEAYARIAGRPLTAWVGEHVQTNIREYRAGPGLGVTQWASSLLLGAIPLGVLFGLARRRLS